MHQLHRELQQCDRVAISAVAGMGGVGKTALAARYARLHQADYPGGTCWLLARERNLGAEIIQFGRWQINLELPLEITTIVEQAAWVWRHWQPSTGEVLVVLDDVTDWGNCLEVLPRDSRYRVLITTRLRNLDPQHVREIPLDVLSPDEANQLLSALVEEQRVKREPSVAKNLCQQLGYLPLGIELVGCYLREDPDLSLHAMLQRLAAQSLQDEALEPLPSLNKLQRGVKAAFELSWQELTATAQQLGAFLSLLAPDVIPWNLVAAAGKSLGWTEAEINDAKKQLYKRHLIQTIPDKTGCYTIHLLIREFLKLKFNQIPEVASRAQEFRRALAAKIVLIAQAIPEATTQDLIAAVQDYISQIVEVAKNLVSALSDEDVIWPYVGLGRFYNGQGLYGLAEPWYEQCLSATKERLGEEHPHVATSFNNLALLYYSQGRYEEAEPLYLSALEMRKKLLGEEHPHVANSLNNLAALYDSQGRYEKAEPLYPLALEMRKKLLGEEHPDVATSLNNLAALYKSQGRYQEAEPLYLLALEMRKKLLGEEHPDVATSLNNLATLYKSQGRYEKAEPLYLLALEMWKKLLGEEHPHVATSLSNLAALYDSQGRYEKAEPLYLLALEMRKKLLGEEHPHVANSLSNLALLYYSQGRYEKAEPLYLSALEMTKKLLGEEHPHVATSLNNLALLYYSQGRYEKAEPLYLSALEMTKKLLGEEHPDVATSLNNLAALYDSQGRYEKAEPLYLLALEMTKKLLGEEHPDVANSLNNLAFLYYSQGRYPEAEPLYLQAVKICTAALGANHPNTITFRKNLAILQVQIKASNSPLAGLKNTILGFFQRPLR